MSNLGTTVYWLPATWKGSLAEGRQHERMEGVRKRVVESENLPRGKELLDWERIRRRGFGGMMMMVPKKTLDAIGKGIGMSCP